MRIKKMLVFCRYTNKTFGIYKKKKVLLGLLKDVFFAIKTFDIIFIFKMFVSIFC